jgi:antitoxin component YwqK of YwqJK toxin-antitoxin module
MMKKALILFGCIMTINLYCQSDTVSVISYDSTFINVKNRVTNEYINSSYTYKDDFYSLYLQHPDSGNSIRLIYEGKSYGPVIVFYPNNKVKSISNYINGYLFGLYLEYYENGNLKTKGNYFNVETNGNQTLLTKKTVSRFVDPNDISVEITLEEIEKIEPKCGEWQYYNEDGSPKVYEVWNNGILISTKYF